MKTRKREFIAVLALLLGAALLILGCPSDPVPDVTEPPPPGGTEEPQQYTIRLFQPTAIGTVSFSHERAVRDTTITITLNPNPGYELNGISAWSTSTNSNIQLSGSGYSYTFTMPASNVQISVEFKPLLEVISNKTGAISVYSSWDEIDALNALIKKAPDPRDAIVVNAINTLVGVANPGGAAVGGYPQKYEPTAVTNYYQGVIRAKIRNEDLTKWIPSVTWAVDPIQAGSVIKEDPLTDDTLGADRTYLYYVREGNPADPDFTPGKGWIPGIRHQERTRTAQVGTGAPAAGALNAVLDEITIIPLVYEVGNGGTTRVTYDIWLWPVAQYTLQYDLGAAGSVTIEDHNTPNPLTALPPAGPMPLTASSIPGSSQTLRGNDASARGNVGKLFPLPNLRVPNERELYVNVTTNQPNVLINVFSSSGEFVKDVNNVSLSNVSMGTPGQFYPESRYYVIRVRPMTPPTGL